MQGYVLTESFDRRQCCISLRRPRAYRSNCESGTMCIHRHRDRHQSHGMRMLLDSIKTRVYTGWCTMRRFVACRVVYYFFLLLLAHISTIESRSMCIDGHHHRHLSPECFEFRRDGSISMQPFAGQLSETLLVLQSPRRPIAPEEPLHG